MVSLLTILAIILFLYIIGNVTSGLLTTVIDIILIVWLINFFF